MDDATKKGLKANEKLVPESEVKKLKARISELERVLGKKNPDGPSRAPSSSRLRTTGRRRARRTHPGGRAGAPHLRLPPRDGPREKTGSVATQALVPRSRGRRRHPGRN